MIFKTKEISTVFTYLFLSSSAFFLYAQDDKKTTDNNSDGIDPVLKGELAYVEELVSIGLPDFAEIVIAETKKKWPEAEALFFAIEIRGMLLLGKSAEAEAKIAALPDRNSSKYWAARLEVANDHYNRNRNEECLKIYDEFFKNNQRPPKELVELVRKAYWQRAQIETGMKRFEAAAESLKNLMDRVDKSKGEENANVWCNAASDAADLYLRVAEDSTGDKRKKNLEQAQKIISELLWERDRYVFFGRAIAMKAHLELLKGQVGKAQAVINDFMGDLSDIHSQLENADPEGRLGLLKLSPMPQCRYLLAKMLWGEVKKEAAKACDKNRIGDLLFGEKLKKGGRNNAGAYNHAINVFIRYPHSPWASPAEKMVGEIENFMDKKFGKKITTKVTPAQRALVRQIRFRNADEKFASGDLEAAIEDYYSALATYPEDKESIGAIHNIVNAYHSLINRTTDDTAKADIRFKIDAVEGYLAERFAENSDASIMIDAGNAVLTLAAKEKQLNELSRSEALYMAFITNYKKHSQASSYAAQFGGQAYQEAERLGGDAAAAKYREAIKYFRVVDELYPNSIYHSAALSSISACYEKLGDKDNAVNYLSRYIKSEKNPLLQMQSSMRLATIYQKDGFNLLATASTNETAEAIAAQENKAVVSIVRGIMEFKPFSEKALAMLSDSKVSAEEKAKYQKLYETALFYGGYCWSRLIEPAKRNDFFSKRNIDPYKMAVESLESYVAKYPTSELFAKSAYLQLSAIYTMVNDVEKTKSALDRLCKNFPDSTEARTAWPRLARGLVEYSATIQDPVRKQDILKESSRIYADMIRAEKSNYHPNDFVLAGESLVAAEDWSLANEAFDKAIMKAGTNMMSVVARSRLGKAKALYAKKDYIGAREHLDSFFEDKRISAMPIATNACSLVVEIAMLQGKAEGDAQLRDAHYAAANAAVEKLRRYWAKEPQWKLDTVDLMSADVRIAKAAAEEAKSLAEQSASTRGKVAAALQTFIQTRIPLESKPQSETDASSKAADPAKVHSGMKTFEELLPEEIANLEAAYVKLIPTLLKIGSKQADRAMLYSEQYLRFFPNGANKDLILRCIKEAEAFGAKRSLGQVKVEKQAIDANGAGEASSEQKN